MSLNDGILDLVVRRAPFLDLRSGIKPEEYRDVGWAMRLLRIKYLPLVVRDPTSLRAEHFQPYHTARISNGYQRNRESFLRPIRQIRWGVPNPAWTYGIIAPKPCFVIDLEAP